MAAEPGPVAEIIDRCARLPLALAVVAARAASRPTFPLSALVAELREAGGDLDGLAGTEPSTDVRSVFSWSYQALSTAARQVFAALGLAPGVDISLTAVNCLTALPVETLRAPMRELENGYLVEQTLPNRYRMHDLLRLYATELAKEIDGTARHAALRRLVDMYLVVAGRARSQVMFSPRIHEVVDVSSGDPSWPEFQESTEALDWLDTERANLIALVKSLAEHGWHDDVWRFAWLLHGFFRARQHKADWLEIGRLGVSAADRTGDHLARFHAANCLGGAYMAAERWDEAIALYQDALVVTQADNDLEKTAIVMNNIGISLVNSGDAVAAIDYLEQALTLARQAGSVDDEAVYSLNLGDGYNAIGRYLEGLSHNQAARKLFHTLGKRLHGAIAAVNIAQSYFGLADLAKAADTAEQASAEFRALGAWYDLAKHLLWVGHIRTALGQKDLATQAWTDAMDTFQRMNDPRAHEVQQLLNESI
ncbi:tetratricopeptide repeat protein [Actinokineospora iranica]|uniref:Tetratricopeptide repeat-containing protein n=1 Tax=Actinokineospora iranica TaxID=1271860 RepID=A0A1G6KTH3_9PSEU|nr:tetratricopeptide repeat protein [Actinokineospora iranica]SDC34274.1 Tetratricopeptide repeat-containing protein [Actinokineospora iranica]